MTHPIRQTVKLAASPMELYSTYVDSKKHSAMTGVTAKIGKKAGGKWSAFGGSIYGRTLMVVPGKMIVQAWRSTMFKKSDPDSILVMMFSKAPGGSRIEIVHVNVPVQDYKGVTNGWKKYYWDPWKAYLGRKR